LATKQTPLNATHNNSLNYSMLRVSRLWPHRIAPSPTPLFWFIFVERTYVKC